MSQYFSKRYQTLTPYTPGEQPQDRTYVKLNTNESPFPPSPGVVKAVADESGKLQLYSDPESKLLRQKMAALYGLDEGEVVMTNGSDEVLNFAFMAFADEERPLLFPDITYGFYEVFAEINHIPYQKIPVKADFSIDPQDYCQGGYTVVIANPNAPTGLYLPLEQIEKILKANKNSVVIVDEAYIDFGGKSAVTLVKKYPNLLVTGTFSKSRSMAGARLGFGFGSKELIADLNTIRYSTNPYNVNRLTCVAGIAALDENDYYMQNCQVIMENRAWTTEALTKLGFEVIPSMANFVFAKHPKISGETLYRTLKEKGILVRHFTSERIKEYNRMTIGSMNQMQSLVSAIQSILKENNL